MQSNTEKTKDKLSAIAYMFAAIAMSVAFIVFAEYRSNVDCQKRWKDFNYETKYSRGSGCMVKSGNKWVLSENIKISR